MIQGRIIKGVGGFYTVVGEDKCEYVIKAAGKLRNGMTPLPGDIVEFDPSAGNDGAFYRILPRKSILKRPRVANVDTVIAVISADLPKPDYILLDKLCAMAYREGIRLVAVMNKSDLASNAERIAFIEEYAAFSSMCISSVTGEGIDTLREAAKGVVCFAGQSGVGKSSITSALVPGRDIETSGLSIKTGRGKHTTRFAELLKIDNGFLVDTPGFSLMELSVIEPNLLKEYYPEMEAYNGKCRFDTCVHYREPGCVVKDAVSNGKFSLGRYERYITIFEEMNERWKNRYE